MKSLRIIAVLVLMLSCISCAGIYSSPHARHRGYENWGGTGYTAAEIRAMSLEQFQQAYLKAVGAADINAAWARSEALWYKTKGKQQKSLFGEIWGAFQDTTAGAARDLGKEARRGLRKKVRDW